MKRRRVIQSRVVAGDQQMPGFFRRRASPVLGATPQCRCRRPTSAQGFLIGRAAFMDIAGSGVAVGLPGKLDAARYRAGGGPATPYAGTDVPAAAILEASMAIGVFRHWVDIVSSSRRRCWPHRAAALCHLCPTHGAGAVGRCDVGRLPWLAMPPTGHSDQRGDHGLMWANIGRIHRPTESPAWLRAIDSDTCQLDGRMAYRSTGCDAPARPKLPH